MSAPLSILLLADERPDHAANVLQHIAALRDLSGHQVKTFNPVGETRPRSLALDQFDVVVIHYSLLVIGESYLPAWLAADIAAFRGLKVQFIQDEYRSIDAITAKMRELGIGLLFSVVPPSEVPKLYADRVPGMTTVTTLTGFVPDELLRYPAPPLRERPVDVGYRGRDVPFWLGRFGQEKPQS